MSDAASSIALVHHAASLSPEGPLPVAGGVTSAAAPPDGVPVAIGCGVFVVGAGGVTGVIVGNGVTVPTIVVVATGVFVGVRVGVRVGVFAAGVFVGCAAACTVIVPAMPPPLPGAPLPAVPWKVQ